MPGRKLVSSVFALAAAVAVAQDNTPLGEFVDGFPLDLEKQTRKADYNELFRGGDPSAYFNMRASEFMPTAILPSRPGVMPLGSKPMPEVGKVKAEMTSESKLKGPLTLDEFLQKSDGAQAFLVVHKGNIVYEKYPRMRPADYHLWMSSAKPTASLVIDQLISEGKIDEGAPITKYLTDFKGTDWDGVTTGDVLDMATGMDLEDTSESRFDPDNIARRVYEAEFGFPNETRGVEKLRDVLRSTPKKEEPGLAFEYASGLTQMLVLLAEEVEGERWPQLFDRRVWSKVGAEGVLQIHLTPDGIAAAHGLVSSNLRDFARFGMLYTPSWDKIAVEKVVSDEILDRIRNEVRTHEFVMAGFDGPVFADYLGSDDFIANSRQWDVIWPDGDMWKGGLMTQGLYVSPSRDLVIVYFNVSNDDHSGHRFARPIATSGLFDAKKPAQAPPKSN
ncbi:serine hydrolase domain-containing protein [Microbulbifer yueqingensis]|uniref:CubicO group peptidase, beta-lactamase class C family n=1 Tax=Microbulbifer yueqingensis TaxID=658219 RepID=A0A1G9A1G5_9GAMM|nr:serine hydrolase domain-containing protein [Microbulbifer yueqingensis]SDK21202.1 CubicO group peptidase, beta-lactamase class C family [Microbulbifer yueqingensis]